MSNIKEDSLHNQDADVPLYAHKYAVHFDILPQIPYLNQEIPIVIANLLPLFEGFPKDVWISQQTVDEGLDFCRVVFWVFSESSNALKTFGIWFQALFRETQVAETLEHLVVCALDEPNTAEVELTDWTRLHALETDIEKAIQAEKGKKEA